MKLPNGVVVWTSKGKFEGEIPDHLVPKKMKAKFEKTPEKKPEKKSK